MDFDQGNLLLACGDRLLLGDHGYHTEDTDGGPLHAAATWLHSTLTYGADPDLSSGYTGLERAPDPAAVHLGETFDWVAHRIVNTNYRLLGSLRYHDQVPAPVTVHLRQWLVVKPDYVLVRDLLEAVDGNPVFWLHAHAPFEPRGDGHYRSGAADGVHLDVRFAGAVTEVRRRQVGPLWCLGVRAAAPTAGFLVLLTPQTRDRGLVLRHEPGSSTVTVRGDGVDDTLTLPAPGAPAEVPRVVRGEPCAERKGRHRA
jgi:hypothetical protein